MPHLIPQKQKPFLELLSNAEEVDIRELPHRASDTSEANPRTFFVRVKDQPKPPPPPKQPSIAFDNEYMQQSAELLMENGDYVLARNIYSALLKKDIEDRRSLFGFGNCLLKLGDFTAAKKCFNAIWELYRDETALFGLAICFSKMGDDDTSLTYFKKVDSTSGLSKEHAFEFHKEFGNALTRTREFGEAAAQYSTALEFQPDSDVIYVNLGTLNIQKGNSEEAQSHFDRALSINCENDKAFCGLGLISSAKGDYEMAEEQFRRALELQLDNRIALVQYVAVLDRKDDLAPAEEPLKKYLAAHAEDHNIRYALSAVKFKLGKFGEAEKEVHIVLEREPGHLKAMKLQKELTKNRSR